MIYEDEALSRVIEVGASGIAAGVTANEFESGPSPYTFTADI